MKLLFLAAAAAIAVPAAAQTTTPDPMSQGQAGGQMTAPAGQTPAPTDPATPTTMDQTTPAPMDQTNTTTAPAASAPAADATDPAGGYQPSSPPMNGTPQPGANVVFQPSQSPDQAFPPPPPLDDYPICKAGQTDNCRQRGG